MIARNDKQGSKKKRVKVVASFTELPKGLEWSGCWSFSSVCGHHYYVQTIKTTRRWYSASFLVCLPGAYTKGTCPVLFCISYQCKWAEVTEKREGEGLGGFSCTALHFKIIRNDAFKGAFGLFYFTSWQALCPEDETTILALACERWNARSCQRRLLRVDKSWQKEELWTDIRCPSLFLPQRSEPVCHVLPN